jgi:DivIVA domain-containing protein
MSLRAQDLRSKTFPMRRQGYDPEMVDAFVREVAASLDDVARTGAAEMVHLACEGELKSVLDLASELAVGVKQEAEAAAQQLRSDAATEAGELREQAARLRAEANDAAHKARVQADAIVDQARRAAEERNAAAEREAQAMLDEARVHADQFVEAAHQRVAQLRLIERSLVDCLRKAGGFVSEATTWLGADAGSGAIDLSDHESAEDDEDDGEFHPPSWWSSFPAKAYGQPKAKAPNGNGSNGAPEA